MKRLWPIPVLLLVVAAILLLRDESKPRADRATNPGAEERSPAGTEPESRPDAAGGGSDRPRPTITFTGTVSAEDGHPIQGATVRATALPGPPSATTGRDGEYSLPRMPLGSYPLEASALGYASSFEQASAVPPARVDFVLRREAGLWGRLTDQDGEPVRGSTLLASSAPDRSTQLRAVKTNEAGEFLFADAGEGEWWLDLTPPKEGRWRAGRAILVSTAESPLALRLPRVPPGPSTLVVDVVAADSGEPITADDAALWAGDRMGPQRSVFVEVSRGRIRAPDLQPGPWRLRFKTGGEHVERRFTVPDGELSVRRTVVVGARGRITGRAVPQSAAELPATLALTTRPPHEGHVAPTEDEHRKFTAGFALLKRERGYSFRMDSVRSGMTVWLVVHGENTFGRTKVVVAAGGETHAEIPVFAAGTLTVRLPHDLKVRPVTIACWPDGKRDWVEIGGLAAKDLDAEFQMPAGLACWRVEYPDPYSGERIVREGSVEVGRGQAVVVEPELE